MPTSLIMLYHHSKQTTPCPLRFLSIPASEAPHSLPEKAEPLITLSNLSLINSSQLPVAHSSNQAREMEFMLAFTSGKLTLLSPISCIFMCVWMYVHMHILWMHINICCFGEMGSQWRPCMYKESTLTLSHPFFHKYIINLSASGPCHSHNNENLLPTLSFLKQKASHLPSKPPCLLQSILHRMKCISTCLPPATASECPLSLPSLQNFARSFHFKTQSLTLSSLHAFNSFGIFKNLLFVICCSW